MTHKPMFLTIITPDGEHYSFSTTDQDQVDSGLQLLDDLLRNAAESGSLSAWWALEGRYRYRRIDA